MASTTSDGSEQESPNPSEQNGDGSESGLRAADPEPAVKMDGAETDEKLNGHESTEQSPEEATRADGEDGETEAEPEKEQQKSPGSADGTAERMKREQREEENASSPAEKNSNGGGGGMKRRASLEMMSSSSDGEPLSRMDSEDRCVNRPSDSPIFIPIY